MRRLNLGVARSCAVASAALSLLMVQAAVAAGQCDPAARVACRTHASQKKTACIRTGSAVKACDRAYTDQLNACMAAAHCPVYPSPLRPH